MSSILDVHTEPKRDRYGRYLIQPAAGGKPVAHTRATTVAETLNDRYNLELWKMRQVAVGLARRPDLLAKVAADDTDKKAVNAACNEAMDAAESGAAANTGTALHRILERVDIGELTVADVPDMFAQVAADHVGALAAHGIEVVPDWCERVHVLTALDEPIAGMADNHVIVDGRRYILDKKTGAGIDYGARGFAVQLAIYAHAETVYDYTTETHEAMPPIDRERAIIEHVPAKGGPVQFWWIDIAAGWDALEQSLWARRWRKRKDLLVPFADPNHPAPPGAVDGSTPPQEGQGTATHAPPAAPTRAQKAAMVAPPEHRRKAPQEATQAAWIVARYDALLAHADIPPGAVKRAWPEGLPGPKQAVTMNTHQRQLAAEALQRLEDEYEAPFTPTDPEAPPHEPRHPDPPARTVEADPLPQPAQDLRRADDASAAALKRRYEHELTDDQRATVTRWLAEGATAQRPWNMGNPVNVLLRRFEISRAAIALAALDWDDDRCRTAVGSIIGEDWVQRHPVGALLGTLSVGEACDLADTVTAAAS